MVDSTGVLKGRTDMGIGTKEWWDRRCKSLRNKLCAIWILIACTLLLGCASIQKASRPQTSETLPTHPGEILSGYEGTPPPSVAPPPPPPPPPAPAPSAREHDWPAMASESGDRRDKHQSEAAPAPAPESEVSQSQPPRGKELSASKVPHMDDPEDVETRIQKTLGSYKPGRIAFNTPKEMEVGETRTVEAIIYSGTLVSIPKDQVIRSFAEKRNIQIEELSQVGTVMKVELWGDDFKISTVGNAEQTINRDSFNRWIWDVTALKPGEKKLHLKVSLVIRNIFPGFPDIYVTQLDKNLDVRVNLGYVMGRTLVFMKEYQGLLFSTSGGSLLVLGLYLYRRFRKKDPGTG